MGGKETANKARRNIANAKAIAKKEEYPASKMTTAKEIQENYEKEKQDEGEITSKHRTKKARTHVSERANRSPNEVRMT
jgi:predicted type IV restriction endonuclease